MELSFIFKKFFILFAYNKYNYYLCIMKKKSTKEELILNHTYLDLGLYGDYRLHIVISKNICKARNKFSKQLDGRVVEDENWGGMHSYAGGCNFESFIFLPPDSPASVIAHESFHATVRVMKVIGAKLNKGSEESYAYLLDHIVEAIHNILDELNKKK